MTLASRNSQAYGCIQSLLFNNAHGLIQYHVRNESGAWVDQTSMPAPVRRLYETEAAAERTFLQTVQFVHHMVIPPGGRHVAELHIHPDAEELVVIVRGKGTMILTKSVRQQQLNRGQVAFLAKLDQLAGNCLDIFDSNFHQQRRTQSGHLPGQGISRPTRITG